MDKGTTEKPKLPTLEQESAGGVAYRTGAAGVEVALISVGTDSRWQLPKGTVEKGETPAATALREVREEAGIETVLKESLGAIEYWFVSSKGSERVRIHKRVHFFLLQYLSGEVTDHDYEVNEARWVPLAQAKELLTFETERQTLEKAEQIILSSGIQPLS